jgi:hypothetical protein
MARTKANGLTVRQAGILVEITEYALRNRGRFPSYREIMQMCDISSKSVVNYNMQAFEERGYVKNVGDLRPAYILVGISVMAPNWYYDIKAQYIDAKREVLDVNWNAVLENT